MSDIVERQINGIKKNMSLVYLRKRLKNLHPRTRKAQLNTIFGLVIKGGGMIISLLLVPITIDYLSKDTYGTWLTISSIVTMITFFDIGIGSGLRNKLTVAVSQQDMVLARAYVSTAYLIFGILQLSLILLFSLLFRLVPWQRILNTKIDDQQLHLVVLIMAVAISIKLVLDILSYVLFALQESSRVGLINFISNVIVLIGTYALTRFTFGNLVYIGLVTAFSPILVLILAGLILYRDRLKAYKPAFQFANISYAKSLLSLGYKFFIIQMAVIVVFYTDNLVITQIFGPAEVTTYNVAFRYFNAINTLFTITITPYWSAFTEAFDKNDQVWMIKTYRYMQRLWLGLLLVVILMISVSDQIYSLWIGTRVVVPIQLSICMGIFVIISCWNSITVTVANGLGKVRLQLMYASAAAVINVPLAILFSKGIDAGSCGVVLATSTSLLIGSVLGQLQARKLLMGTARGIWNQ